MVGFWNQTPLLKWLDRTAGPGAAWLAGLGLRRRKAAAPDAPLLVIRPGGIGDAAVLLPVISALRSALPAHRRIDILCEPRNRAVFDRAGLPNVRVLSYSDRPLTLPRRLRRAGYGDVVDTEQSHWFSAVFAAWTRAPRRLGFDTVSGRARLYTTTVPYEERGAERDQFRRLIAAAVPSLATPDDTFPAPDVSPVPGVPDTPFAVVHVGGSNRSKRWPADRYAALCDGLRNRFGLDVILVGGRNDAAETERIAGLCTVAPPRNLAGALALAETWALCARASLFVGPDSGIAHLADLSGTPGVILFGSGDPAKWGPRHGRAVCASPLPACAPCSRYGTLHRRRGCRHECIRDIRVEDVLDEIARLGRFETNRTNSER